MKNEIFKSAWWLPNSHLQTIWPALLRRPIKSLVTKRERFELSDGDFVDLDWAISNATPSCSPIVLILHGLEGSIESPYAQGMLHAIARQGWRGVIMHFRSCSGEPNRLPRLYHSGETNDVQEIITILRDREPDTQIAGIGFSMGGNVLLKWLGETREKNFLNAAVAVSVPFELDKTVNRLQQGFSRVYEWHIMRQLREKIQTKFSEQNSPIDLSNQDMVRTIREFDEKITVPLHGFASVDEYYQKSSSRQYLKHIQIPTLLVQALDDPFMTEDIIPEPHEISAYVQLEVTKNGGHVGFISGKYPWRPEYWLEQRIPLFLTPYFNKNKL